MSATRNALMEEESKESVIELYMRLLGNYRRLETSHKELLETLRGLEGVVAMMADLLRSAAIQTSNAIDGAKKLEVVA